MGVAFADVLNQTIADVIFGGNTTASGMILTILVGIVLFALFSTFSKDGVSFKVLLIPMLMAILVCTAIGWVSTTIMVILIIAIGGVVATLSDRFA